MEEKEKSYTIPMVIITTLFFAWGFITVLNDILIPHFRNVFDLSYADSTLIQMFFFGAYFVMSIPGSFMLEKFGYQKGIVIGLGLTSLGAFLFYPASIMMSYGFFLAAFFVLASGLTMLQVSANPYVTKLGKEKFASSRLNLAQGFNSLGTALAPLVGSVLILGGMVFMPFYPYGSDRNITLDESKYEEYKQDLSRNTELIANQPFEVQSVIVCRDSSAFYQTSAGLMHKGKYLTRFGDAPVSMGKAPVGALVNLDKPEKGVNFVDREGLEAFRKAEADAVQFPYILIGSILLVLAAFFYFIKLPKLIYNRDKADKSSLMQYPHLISGSVAIFVYVGAEVAIGSFLVLFFELDEIAGLPEMQGGYYVSFYWLAAMIGRFIGALLQRFIAPNKVLAAAALSSFTLVAATIMLDGQLAMWTIISVGLFNSIMFPTIFSLSIEDTGKHTSRASGLLIMMIVGGAVIPWFMGLLADSIGIQAAFSIALVCYAYILFFAVKGYKLRKSEA